MRPQSTAPSWHKSGLQTGVCENETGCVVFLQAGLWGFKRFDACGKDFGPSDLAHGKLVPRSHGRFVDLFLKRPGKPTLAMGGLANRLRGAGDFG